MFFEAIDVSKHQGVIDWELVKNSGVKGVIIRAGYGRSIDQIDPYFSINYKNAKRVGLHVGAYWYSYAKNVMDARAEANTCLKAIEGKCFDLPIYYDIEEKDQLNEGSIFCGSLMETFGDILEGAGYFTGLYMSYSQIVKLPERIRSRFTVWVAKWSDKLPEGSKFGMWQYSSKGAVPGIVGYVDLDKVMIDFPYIIRRAKLNGYNDMFNLALYDQIVINDDDLEILRDAREKLEALRDKYM